MIYIKLQNCCVSFFEVYFEGGTLKLYTNQLKDVCNEVHFFWQNFCFSVFLTNFCFPENLLAVAANCCKVLKIFIRLEVFCRKGVLRNFAKFTGKHLRQSLSIEKETSSQVFSCGFSGISKNTFFIEHLRWLLLKRLSKGGVSLEVTIFTKNFILGV